MAATWLEKYRRAWASNQPDDIRALFTDDAVYRTSPLDEQPWRGIDEIVDGWTRDRDEPGDWRFSGEPIARDGELAFVQGRTDYSNGDVYANLWLIRFADDGRAREFTEWYMSPR